MVVEIKLRAQRRELEPLEEAPIHLDVGDLLDGRQHPAEKGLDLLAREREAIRVAEGLEERAHGLRVRRIDGVDGARRIEVAGLAVKHGQTFRLERQRRPLLPEVRECHGELRPLVAHAHLFALLLVEPHLTGRITEDGEKFLEKPRRQLAFLLVEEIARPLRAIGGKGRAIGEHIHLLMARVNEHLPELLGKRIGKMHGGGGKREILAHIDLRARLHLLEEEAEIAHDVELVDTDAELEPFHHAAELLREEEARHEVQVGRFPCRRRAAALPAENMEEPRTVRPAHLRLASLRILDLLEHGHRMLAGAEVELRRGAVAGIVLDTIALLREADLDLVRLLPLHAGAIDAVLLLREVENTPLLIIAHAPLIRGIVRERPDGDVLEHDAASSVFCINTDVMLK